MKERQAKSQHCLSQLHNGSSWFTTTNTMKANGELRPALRDFICLKKKQIRVRTKSYGFSWAGGKVILTFFLMLKRAERSAPADGINVIFMIWWATLSLEIALHQKAEGWGFQKVLNEKQKSNKYGRSLRLHSDARYFISEFRLMAN